MGIFHMNFLQCILIILLYSLAKVTEALSPDGMLVILVFGVLFYLVGILNKRSDHHQKNSHTVLIFAKDINFD